MILAQKAVLKRGRAVLVLRRADDESAFPGLWDFPGGRWEEGEDFLASLVREVGEETGFAIKPKPLPVGVYHADVRPGRPVEFRIYEVENYTGEFQLSSEHTAAEWVEPSELLKRPTMPYMAQFLSERKI